MSGMSRWVRIGPIQLNVMSLGTPVILAIVARFRNASLGIYRLALILAAAACLAFAPDLSQATALTAGFIVLLSQRAKIGSGDAGTLIFLLAACTIAYRSDVQLPPVPHVERIYEMAHGISPFLGILSFIAPLLIGMSPLLRGRDIPSAACAVCLTVPVLFSYTKLWPVPFIGYGASPILAAASAITILSAKPRIN